jgi:hypothetical protein
MVATSMTTAARPAGDGTPVLPCARKPRSSSARRHIRRGGRDAEHQQPADQGGHDQRLEADGDDVGLRQRGHGLVGGKAGLVEAQPHHQTADERADDDEAGQRAEQRRGLAQPVLRLVLGDDPLTRRLRRL